MAQELGAECIPVKDLKAKDIASYDLIGFGSGIYFSQHHKSLLDAIDTLPPAMGKKAFVFSTAGFPAGKFMFHSALKTKLTAKGFFIAGEFSCRGLDTYKIFGAFGGMNKGHPDENDIKRHKSSQRELPKIYPDGYMRFRTLFFSLLDIGPQPAGFSDILQFVLIDHDRDQVRFDLQRSHERVSEFLHNYPFLVDRPAFSHLDDNDGHNGTLVSGRIGCGSI